MYIVLKHFAIYYCYFSVITWIYAKQHILGCKLKQRKFPTTFQTSKIYNLLAGLITVIQTTLTCHMYFFKDILYNCTFSQVSLIFNEWNVQKCSGRKLSIWSGLLFLSAEVWGGETKVSMTAVLQKSLLVVMHTSIFDVEGIDCRNITSFQR